MIKCGTFVGMSNPGASIGAVAVDEDEEAAVDVLRDDATSFLMVDADVAVEVSDLSDVMRVPFHLSFYYHRKD